MAITARAVPKIYTWPPRVHRRAAASTGCLLRHMAYNLASYDVYGSSAMNEIALKHATEFAKTPPLAAHVRVQKGIALGEVVRFANTTDLTQEELAGLLGLPTRTYQRWLAEPGKKLDQATGGRYYRMLKVIRQAAELLGSMTVALQWLRSEQRALGYRIPLKLLATDPGVEAVEDLLGRIEYGVIT
jgi:putative toxin-antitoxin system antitoxin component (TIGR02293 family)